MKLDLGRSAYGAKRDLTISNGEMILRQEEDATPVLNNNQRLRNDGGGRLKTGHHVASIPIMMYQRWRQEWQKNHADKWAWNTFLAMRIRDRDYSKLRTSDARV